MPVADPHLEVETDLLGGARFVIGCDEVGRGAIAGPVGVGLVVIDGTVGKHPPGLRDSKMLSEKRREEFAPLARAWVLHSAVGLATAAEIDSIGIMAALGLAARRALTDLHEAGARIDQSVVLLDGSHDWLTPALSKPPRVYARPKADRDCASVAAASVIAKVHRDRLMIEADARIPGYGWADNKGYGSAEHLSAIDRQGASELHRHSWLRTPGLDLLEHG
ncbi:MAG: ribonuclease HII [Salinibacterium sp.]|nr:MAG: ribonuclease HII [Salinibacterium sp.]